MTLTRRDARPHPGLLPQEKENYPPSRVMSCVGIGRVAFAKPELSLAVPSPWGEGQGEGGFL
jgi:hypothetical protein